MVTKKPVEPEADSEAHEATEAASADVDRVAMVSYDAEGNPAQSAGYEVIGQ